MRCKSGHAACCHTTRTPTRCSRPRHGHLCPLNLFSPRRSEMTIRFSLEWASRSPFSLRLHRLSLPFQPILSGSISLSAMAWEKLLPTRLFWGSISELALESASVLAWESHVALESASVLAWEPRMALE